MQKTSPLHPHAHWYSVVMGTLKHYSYMFWSWWSVGLVGCRVVVVWGVVQMIVSPINAAVVVGTIRDGGDTQTLPAVINCFIPLVQNFYI